MADGSAGKRSQDPQSPRPRKPEGGQKPPDRGESPPAEKEELLRRELELEFQAAGAQGGLPGVVRGLLAFALFLLAGLIAGWLVIKGPPPPKVEQAATSNGQVKKEARGDNGAKSQGRKGAKSQSKKGAAAQRGNGAGGRDGRTRPAASASDESVAQIDEAGPWAFAITALIVGLLLAVGSSLSVVEEPAKAAGGGDRGGGKQGTGSPASPEPAEGDRDAVDDDVATEPIDKPEAEAGGDEEPAPPEGDEGTEPPSGGSSA